MLVPIVVPMLTFLYNDSEPRMFGFPRFYWLQLAFVGLGVVCTAIVYRATKRKVPTAKVPTAIVHGTTERKS